MSKKYLWVGPAGSGKTHRILSEFVQAIQDSKDPLSPDLFLVLPSSEHVERMTMLAVQKGLKGFFHRRITTLNRLMTDFFTLPRLKYRIVSSTTRYLILRELITGMGSPYWEKVRALSGFVHLAAGFLTELKDALITVQDFRDRMNRIKQVEPDLAAKYEALASLYEAYERKLKEESLNDPQDFFLEYKDRIQEVFRPDARFRKIWFDGFFDFSALQRASLKALFAHTDEIVISLTKDAGSLRATLFDTPFRTEEELTRLGFEKVNFKTVNHRAVKPALVYLERSVFSSPAVAKPPAAQDTVILLKAAGLQGEIEMIAREILSLMKSPAQYRFSDFAILLRQIGDYEAVIKSVFRRYDIPVEIHERERLKLSPLVYAVSDLVRIFRDGWKRSDLISFLKSSYVRRIGPHHKDYNWIGQFELHAWNEGVLSGRERWMEPWGKGPSGPGEEGFHCQKVKILSELGKLEDALSGNKSAASFTAVLQEAIYETFGIVPEGSPKVGEIRPDESRRLLADSPRDLLTDDSARRDAASLKRLESLFEEIRAHERMRRRADISFGEFADHFLRLVDLDLYSVHHRDKNRVQVYDISLARQKEYRVVFTAGLAEKKFPVQIKEDPIFSDWERRLFNLGAEYVLNERLPRQHLERYLFYLAITRPRERIYLSYPAFNEEGQPVLSSYYVDEVRAAFKGTLEVKSQNLSRPFPVLSEAINPREMEIALIGDLGSGDESQRLPLLRYFANALMNVSSSRERIRKVFYQSRAELSDPAIAAMDAFRSAVSSATRLEEYAQCHFRYFASKVLKLKDPEEDMNFRIKGTVLHQVLEILFTEIIKGRRELRDPVKAVEFALAEFEKAIKEHPLTWEKKYQHELDLEEMKEMLLRFLDAELARLEKSGLQPRHCEFEFGGKETAQAPFLEIDSGGRTMKFSGKIDRIDTDSANEAGLIIDYKRSAQFNKDDLDFGIALQLPLYLMAVEKFLGLKPVGGELYSLKDCRKKGFYHADYAQYLPDLSKTALKYPEREYRALLARTASRVGDYGREMEALNIEVRPRDCDRHCPFPSVCRIEKWKLPLIIEEIREEDLKKYPVEEPTPVEKSGNKTSTEEVKVKKRAVKNK